VLNHFTVPFAINLFLLKFCASDALDGIIYYK